MHARTVGGLSTLYICTLAPRGVAEPGPAWHRHHPAVHKHHQNDIISMARCLQAHFTELILRQMAGIGFPEDRIFSQTVSGRPKSEVLEMLQGHHPDAPGYHFVEDKLSTLQKARGLLCPHTKAGPYPAVSPPCNASLHPLPLNSLLSLRLCCVLQVAKHDELKDWRLYLVDWGYNTEAERRAAAENGGIQVITIDEFQQLAHV
jgi:hypothetical protein